MNIFTLRSTLTARYVAAVALCAMILSAFPASFFVAFAEEIDQIVDTELQTQIIIDEPSTYFCKAEGNGFHKQTITPAEAQAENEKNNGLYSNNGINSGNIIPPIAGIPGKNWDTAGQAIWDNLCDDDLPPAPDGDLVNEDVVDDIPGQCPDGYINIADNYTDGLSWTADGSYASVILVGGPKDDASNDDPDGRDKYFSNVTLDQVISRVAHDISHICATSKLDKPKVHTIEAVKIICEDEALLPNWGFGAPPITAATAADFLSSTPERTAGCYLAPDWQFQWTSDEVLSANTDQMAELLGGNWNTSDFTDNTGSVTIEVSKTALEANNGHISFREAFQEGYIPFSRHGVNNGSDVTAEIYCGDDNQNYDNMEWIKGVEVDETTYCVAWNVPVEPEVTECTLTMVSDELDLVEENNDYAKELSQPYHPSWLPGIMGSLATWIWGDDPVEEPTTVDKTQTFKKSFTWTGDSVTSATLTLASDNSHAITLGTFTGGDAGEVNYVGATEYDVTSAIVAGTNTLEVAVKNFALANSDATSNPAGLIYELTIEGTTTGKGCGAVVPLEPVDPTPKTATVTMCKVDQSQNSLSGWQLALLGDKVGEVSVLPNGSEYTIDDAPAGDYVLKASGTYVYRPTNLPADAAFSTRLAGDPGYATAPYQPWLASTYFAPNNYLGVQVNGTLPWGEVWNPAHIYYASWNPTDISNTGTFKITDTTYGDNTGQILVEAYTGYTGVTGDNGCVVFEDVPYGTYVAEELLQQGWENVSGLGDVVVDEAEVTHTVTNEAVVDPVPFCSVTIVSDETNTVVEKAGAFAKLVTWFHPDWTAVVPAPAQWIWGDDPVVDPVGATTQTFENTFEWIGPVATATLTVAADNTYDVTLNSYFGGDAAPKNFLAADTHDLTSLVVPGTNTLAIEVANIAQANGTVTSNPAGLKYHLEVLSADPNCIPVVTPDDNDDESNGNDDDSSTNTDPTFRPSGGGGVITGTRTSDSDDEEEELEELGDVAGTEFIGSGGDFPVPAVLGEQVSIVPYGAPNAGAGGADMRTAMQPIALLLVMIVLLALVRKEQLV